MIYCVDVESVVIVGAGSDEVGKWLIEGSTGSSKWSSSLQAMQLASAKLIEH